ncbi:uncharacterized protein UTRI_04747_B [Ustilago trichophora]|uniref:Uncharacterized protein n=1 Tax=Ustilago trichophora TaxID=86804 RepID=A0A5C3EGX1_9BASI|nr:uncharacterized protein UTRI_04747_B [Ustilago trichophora]
MSSGNFVDGRLWSVCYVFASKPLPNYTEQHHLSPFTSLDPSTQIRGLDIGTGASAIYPILGVSCFPSWHFIGTDIDQSSLDYASAHIVHHPSNADRLGARIQLVPVALGEAPFLPDNKGLLHFTMCNPPFYASAEEMDLLAGLKKVPANAVCHGTPSEMVTAGGEVAFVQRMIGESLITNKEVLWWTCMLGKLSSVVQIAGELKELAKERKVGGWGGCFVYPSAYRVWGKAERGQEGWKVRDDMGTLDVIVTQESWTRRARRAKLHPQPSSEVALRGDTPKQPLLMTRISVVEVETGLAVKVAWIYGMDSVKFESFAMFLLSAVERKVSDTDAAAAK